MLVPGAPACLLRLLDHFSEVVILVEGMLWLLVCIEITSIMDQAAARTRLARLTGKQLDLVPVLFSGMRAAYPVLSADPGRRVEADNGEEGHDLKPADEQLLICDQVSRKRATCRR